MSIFGRRPHVTGVVGDGFVAAEAPALQTSLVAALTMHERAAERPVTVELRVDRGRGTRLVLSARNVVIGFVPPDEVPLLAAQLPSGRALLVVPGVVYHQDGLWRLWVGPEPSSFPAPADDLDTLPVPDPSIAGIPLKILRPKDDDDDR
ncbi:hypothetical protein GXP71_00130 [Cellulomonas sp. H30R-01]|uniref:hypothetical protein n=1 Tax=Cellulomonas TaxID=1707 RepID=UPI00138B2359|nr:MULTISPECIES: hypothetical protein [Cellulomonas]QHT54662.1 hypothetical protein GXP71_00130 [Cellulomonas sp. H30R-01]